MQSGAWAFVGGLVLLSPLTVLSVRGLLKAAAASEVVMATGDEFRCGVRSRRPPLYATFPRAKLLVADEVIAVRVWTMGDFAVRRGELRAVEMKARAMPVLNIRSDRLDLVVSVSRKDIDAVLAALRARSWIAEGATERS